MCAKAAFREAKRLKRDAIAPRDTIEFCMNPNENDLTRDEPLPGQQFQPREGDIDATGHEQLRRATKKASKEMSETWDQTKDKASRALERTEHFVRENPVPTILGALGLGIAIGLAIRYAAPSPGALAPTHDQGVCSDRCTAAARSARMSERSL